MLWVTSASAPRDLRAFAELSVDNPPRPPPRPGARKRSIESRIPSSSGSPRLAQLAADDDRLEVEGVAEIGEHTAESRDRRR